MEHRLEIATRVERGATGSTAATWASGWRTLANSRAFVNRYVNKTFIPDWTNSTPYFLPRGSWTTTSHGPMSSGCELPNYSAERDPVGTGAHEESRDAAPAAPDPA